MNYKEEVAALPEITGTDTWSVHRKNLRGEMKNNPDWKNFKTWSTVRATIFSGTKTPNVPAQRKMCAGSAWGKALGNYDNENGTVIHQAYSLWLYEKVVGRSLDEDDRYVEFGGGYGEMARLVYIVVAPDEYLVYDLPEMAILQRWYFDTYIGKTTDLVATSDMDDVRNFGNPTVLASICAISEAPMDVKVEFLEACPAESLLIRYQPLWDKINNRKLFTEFAEDRYDDVHHSHAPEFKNHSYLIAWNPK